MTSQGPRIMRSRETCESCGKPLAPMQTVHFGGPDGVTRRLCLACSNGAIADLDDVEFQHVDFAPMKMSAANGVEHEFHFGLRLLGDRVALDAYELLGGEAQGWEFQVIGDDPEGDHLELFGKLLEKMRRALAKRHLQPSELLGTGISEGGVVRARIACDLDREDGDRLPLLVIDGEEISWERFGRMLMTYEGWQFKLEIYDKSEER